MKILSLLLLAVTIASADVVFRLVAPEATSASVKIAGGSTYPLSQPDTQVSYFLGSAAITASSDMQYSYVVNGVEESFTRTLNQGSVRTYNDFYGRQYTTRNLYKLPTVFTDKPTWNRNLGPNGVYDTDYVSTVFFSGANTSELIKQDPDYSGIPLTITIISKDTMISTGCVVGTKQEEEDKLGMTIYLKNSYRGRSTYKLRPAAYDNVYFRETLYNDLLEALGVPHQETAFTRVYINNKGLGMYHLQEEVGSWDFANTQFYGQGGAPSSQGVIYDAGTGSDFVKGNENNFIGSPKTALFPLFDAVAAVVPTDDASVSNFNTNFFDVDTFFRAMMMEYLGGHWDSYWFYTSNFGFFNDVTQGTNKFFFIDQDFDQTLGTSYLSSSYVKTPYTAYVNKGSGWSDGGSTRTMIDKFLSTPKWKTIFEAGLVQIVTKVYNKAVMTARINSLIERVRDDVVWDRTLGSNRVRITNGMGKYPYDPNFRKQNLTVFDFDNGIDNYGKGASWGLTEFIDLMSKYVMATYGGGASVPTNPSTTGSDTTGGTPVTTGDVVVPGTTTGTPAATTGTPAATTGTPAATTGTPAATTGTPAATTGTPASTTAAPASTSATPSTTASTSGIADTTTGDSNTGTVNEESSAQKSIVSIVAVVALVALAL